MIYFFITRKHAYTINIFMREWAAAVKDYLQVIAYDQLPLVQNIAPGAFLFSDLERLNENQLAFLGHFCDQLNAQDRKIPIINDPRTVLTRFGLLRKLHATGFNRFNVHPASDTECQPHYPVFLRLNNDHDGPRSGLLKDESQRAAALLQAVMVGFDMRQLLQVEFCETRCEDGYYRKYSVFRIGGRVLPGHIIFSKDWLAKDGEVPDEAKKREQDFYLKQNPHAEKILEIFEQAGIQFGRIDYSMLDNSIQTWEINTNPILVKPRKEYKADAIPGKEKLAAQLEEAFRSLDYGDDRRRAAASSTRIPLQWDPGKYFRPAD